MLLTLLFQNKVSIKSPFQLIIVDDKNCVESYAETLDLLDLIIEESSQTQE